MRRRELLAAGLAAAAAPAGASAFEAPGERLANAFWAVEIDPATLAIHVTPAGKPRRTVSRGVPGHGAAAVANSGTALAWTWDDGTAIACALDGRDLAIRVTAARPGEIALLDQPAEAFGTAMLYPLGEGHYVPAGDATWADFLTERRGEHDTSEDLSLPLWGHDHGDHGLHWLMLDPFHNRVTFTAEDGGVAIGLAHRFTRLAPGEPARMLLHLGGGDPLAGAKRYRRHLIESGEFRSLADKIAATPSGERLIGATQLYLWNNGLIGEKDVRDWPRFVAMLASGTGLAARLLARFERDTAGLVREPRPARTAYARRTIVAAVNAALIDLARAQWQTDEVDPARIVAAQAGLRAEFAAEFGPALAPDPADWGGGLSKSVFDALAGAGLERLWIGLGDGWEGGLWHAEAVRTAAAKGWLIAPYDSYETAIPPGVRPDWSTAQLGRDAYEQCGVVNADGSTRAGFQKTGHYTNTRCVVPILKARIPALAEAGGFNAWFLDVYATGMVFDDHRPGATMTMQANAAEDIAVMRWVSEDLQLPVASEGGNAVCASGTFVGHGVETPVMGWGDAELQRDTSSPFYLGGWYPPDAPAVFFRPSPMKQPYLAVHLAPANRLPLYQAVFHDSVIATHQWAFDQLKLSNAVADRALAQQLYNVPPLFHLSDGTLAGRLPAILRHDAFFRPLHTRLARVALTGFGWLSDDRLVQATEFEDGTRLIANFADEARRADGRTLPPKSVTAVIDGEPALVFTA